MVLGTIVFLLGYGVGSLLLGLPRFVDAGAAAALALGLARASRRVPLNSAFARRATSNRAHGWATRLRRSAAGAVRQPL